jgi:hypothetical protein
MFLLWSIEKLSLETEISIRRKHATSYNER